MAVTLTQFTLYAPAIWNCDSGYTAAFGGLLVLKIVCDVKVCHCYSIVVPLGLVHILFGNSVLTQLTSAIRVRHAPPCRLLNGDS